MGFFPLLRALAHNDGLRGIIPACAGSTGAHSSAKPTCRDHPRMRGEHAQVTRPRAWAQGSSPHARGALVGELLLRPAQGIIPACAGSTSSLSAVRMSSRGSSPHARGAPEKGAPEPPRAGIIPACAGSTTAGRWMCQPSWDHPRMRGEHGPKAKRRHIERGSSPHARGAPGQRGDVGRCEGIIPACAGSTRARTSTTCTTWDHPRMRGEHRRRR